MDKEISMRNNQPVVVGQWQQDENDKETRQATKGKSGMGASEKVKYGKEIEEKGQEKLRREPSWSWVWRCGEESGKSQWINYQPCVFNNL